MFKLMREKADSFPTTILMLVKGLILVNTCTVITLLITIFLPSCIILRCYSYRCYKTVNIIGFQCSSSSVVFIVPPVCTERRLHSPKIVGYTAHEETFMCHWSVKKRGPALSHCFLRCSPWVWVHIWVFFFSHILRQTFWSVQHSPSPARLPLTALRNPG